MDLVLGQSPAVAAAASAADAAASATAAANSATAAAAAAANAAASFDAFDDRFLGVKTADPTLDNDGNPLIVGALYFSSSSGKMRVHTGSAWQDVSPTATSLSASAVTVTPTGGIVATTAQAALAELDAEKVPTTRLVATGVGLTGGGDLSANRTLSVPNDGITNALLANMAANTIKGNNTGAAGDPLDLTVAQVKTLLNLAGTNNGDQTITLTGDVGGSGTGSFAATIASDAVTNAKLANMAANTIKGNNGGAAGDPLDLTVAQVKTMLNLAGTNNGDQTITLTGDVSGSGTGSFAATIASDAVTNAKLANMAANTIKGNNAGAAGDPLDLGAAQVTAMLPAVVGDAGAGGTKGLVPAPAAGDAAKFLKGDGTWATVPAVAATVPAGAVMPYAGSTVPSGWLLTDGAAVGRTTFADLFAAIGTTYGPGDGSTTFNLPDLRGKFPLGAGSAGSIARSFQPVDVNITTDRITVAGHPFHTGQAVVYSTAGTAIGGLVSGTTYFVSVIDANTIELASSRDAADAETMINLTSQGVGTQTLTYTLMARALGAQGGEESHSLTEEEAPSHNHTFSNTILAGSTGSNGSGGNQLQGGVATNSTTVTLNTAGGDTPHNNLPPFLGLNFIIKT